VFAVGAEEELLLVDAMSGDMSNSGPQTLKRGNWSAGRAVPEICQSVIEFVTPVCERGRGGRRALDVAVAGSPGG
jgi:gamma-glutamyl:cysteine ligase YbdK (ATP-grasp superfamily)